MLDCYINKYVTMLKTRSEVLTFSKVTQFVSCVGIYGTYCYINKTATVSSIKYN
jgi:hypothetical protein